MEKTVQIMSPDGIALTNGAFATKKEAIAYYKQWAKGFEKQGFYSGNKGRIAVEALSDFCEIGTIEPGTGDWTFKAVLNLTAAIAIDDYLSLP